MEGVNENTTSMECPKCHSIAVQMDTDPNSFICQSCGKIISKNS